MLLAFEARCDKIHPRMASDAAAVVESGFREHGCNARSIACTDACSPLVRHLPFGALEVVLPAAYAPAHVGPAPSALALSSLALFSVALLSVLLLSFALVSVAHVPVAVGCHTPTASDCSVPLFVLQIRGPTMLAATSVLAVYDHAFAKTTSPGWPLRK